MKSRARIEDVVQLSGLSRSTVDRVLNNRSGVRAVTRRKVEDALNQLGYTGDTLAAMSRLMPRHISVLLPEGSNPFFALIRQGYFAVSGAMRYQPAEFTMIGFDPYDPKTLCDALKDLPANTTHVISVGVDNPDVTDAIDRLVDRGITFVTIVSDCPRSRRAAYIGQDAFAAGRTAGRLMGKMCSPGEGSVGLLIGHLDFRHLLDRQSGFIQSLGDVRPDLRVMQGRAYGTTREGCQLAVDELFRGARNIKGVYISGGGQPYLHDALSQYLNPDLQVIGHELHEESRKALRIGRLTAVIAHDVVDIFRTSLDVIFDGDVAAQSDRHIHIYFPDNMPPTG